MGEENKNNTGEDLGSSLKDLKLDSNNDNVLQDDTHKRQESANKKEHHGRVKFYDPIKRKGFLSIENIGDVRVDIKDVKDYPNLIINAKVTCEVVKDGDKYVAKNVTCKRYITYLPYYLFVIGCILFFIFKFILFKKYNWSQFDSYWVSSIDTVTLFSYIISINIMMVVLFLYDFIISKNQKTIKVEYKQNERKIEINRPRISEASLHVFEYLGASLSSFVLQRICTHKLNKEYQQTFWWLIVDQALILLGSWICLKIIHAYGVNEIQLLDIFIPVFIIGFLFIIGFKFFCNLIFKSYIKEDDALYYLEMLSHDN